MDQRTVETYDKGAKAYAEKFAGIGTRVEDIVRAFAAWKGEGEPRVLELGCGDGRDALEICKRTKCYTGIDVSKEMIALAKEKIPQSPFVVADLDTYSFIAPTDIIFAFASLLHVNKETFEKILREAHEALSPGGIIYISLKEGKYQGAEVVKDDHGERLFYYYEEADIRAMAQSYEVLWVERQLRGHTRWIEVMLQKA